MCFALCSLHTRAWNVVNAERCNPTFNTFITVHHCSTSPNFGNTHSSPLSLSFSTCAATLAMFRFAIFPLVLFFTTVLTHLCHHFLIAAAAAADAHTRSCRCFVTVHTENHLAVLCMTSRMFARPIPPLRHYARSFWPGGLRCCCHRRLLAMLSCPCRHFYRALRFDCLGLLGRIQSRQAGNTQETGDTSAEVRHSITGCVCLPLLLFLSFCIAMHPGSEHPPCLVWCLLLLLLIALNLISLHTSS